jgi:hypothetical protein
MMLNPKMHLHNADVVKKFIFSALVDIIHKYK